MQRLKRILAGFLTLVLLVTSVPVQAFAVQDTGNTQASMDSQDVDFEGTNAVGSLLAEAIAQEQQSTIVSSEDTPYEDGYTLTDIVVQGSVATVTYDAMEEAQLVVALYTDDGIQLLNTAKTTVTPEATTATVTFSGQMPQYFVAAAYLLDVYDFSPLCPSYETPMYTQDMQELLDMTVADCVEEYGEERIYNLDDNAQTNFAVYAEGAVLLYEEDGVNTVTSADDVNLVYVIANADDRVTSLTEGSILVYEYADGELLLIKVGSITVDGTTVTIQGTDMELEEVFAIMKVEADANTEDTTFDPTGLEENIEYLGMGSPQTYSAREGLGYENEVGHTFYLHGENHDGGSADEVYNATPKPGVSGDGEFEASIFIGLGVEFDFYISMQRQYMDFRLKPTIKLKGELSGYINFQTKQLGKGFDIYLCPGVYAHMHPTLNLKFTGSLVLEASVFFTLGFSVNHPAGESWSVQNLCSKPEFEIDPKLECKIFIGFDFHPGVKVISEKVCNAELSSLLGVEAVGTQSLKLKDYSGSQLHDCTVCIDGDVFVKGELKLKLQFLNSKHLTVERVFADTKLKLCDFYWSIDYGEFAFFKTCPHYRYRVYVKVMDKDENLVEGTEVYYLDGKAEGGKTVIGTTNSNGVVMDETIFGNPRNVFLPAGNYTFETVVNGEAIRSPNPVEIYTYTSTVLTSSKEYWERQEKLKLLMIKPDKVSASSLLGSGQCGDNLNWRFYSSGLLEIDGEGDMDDYSSAAQAPWYRFKGQITSLRIGDPTVSVENLEESQFVTVGSYAFDGYTNLKKVILEDNVSGVKIYSFRNCTGLQEIKMPVDLDLNCNYNRWTSNPTYYSSFMGTTNVSNIHYTYGRTGKMTERKNTMPQTDLTNYYYDYLYQHSLEYHSRKSLLGVYFDEQILDIAGYAFYGAGNLKDAAIPSTVTLISGGAFYGCSSLLLDQLPANLVTLGSSAFYGCRSLTKMVIPSGITAIYDNCFSECTGLEEITIPDTVTSLGNRAFCNCTGLKKVTMPIDLDIYRKYKDAYIRTDESTFEGCSNVETIHYTYGQTGKMTERTNINTDPYYTIAYSYDWSLEYFSNGSLKEITFDSKITDIADGAFYKCSKLTSVKLPSGITSIGNSAFYGCTNLTLVTLPDSQKILPDSLKTLGASAFYGCRSLTKMVIPSGITAIYDNCFGECTGLEEITIPDTVTSLGNRAFYNCTGLKKVTMPIDLDIYRKYKDAYIRTDESTFEGCSNVETIHYTYGQTGKMTERTNINTDPYYTIAYSYDWSLEYFSHSSLKSITFAAGIVDISANAFKSASNLTNILFLGDAPIIASNSFSGVTADALYPYDNDTWTEDTMQNYGGTLTWTPYILDEDGSIRTEFDSNTVELEPEETEPEETEPVETEPVETEPVETETAETEPVETEPAETEPAETEPAETEPAETEPVETEPVETESVETEAQETVPETTSEQIPSSASAAPEEDVPIQGVIGSGGTNASTPAANAVYGGMNEAEFEDATGAVIQSTSFNGLVSGSEYVMFALVSMEAEDLLAPGNILYIGQAPADNNGSLTFRYIQKTPTDKFNVFACGASHRHLRNASITFPNLSYNGDLHIAEPTVTYSGKTLVEGVDYIVLDGQGAENAGDYLCTIRGICNYTGLITCKYTVNAGVNTVAMAAEDLDGQATVWIDGAEYGVATDGDMCYVNLPDSDARTMTIYTYHTDNDTDDQTNYPVGMKVWTLENEAGIYTASRQESFDDILQYAGMSIRVTGKKGIRMITAMEQTKKQSLTAEGLAGYTLKEYGTVVAWAGKLENGQPLVLGQPYALSNYAYRKGIQDAVFDYRDNLMQYTNVLVNFTDEQCSKVLALRPYIILQDSQGETITIYGGILYRSIGYIAYQNRNAFEPRTEAYAYIWDIIRSTYGHVYDDEFVPA